MCRFFENRKAYHINTGSGNVVKAVRFSYSLALYKGESMKKIIIISVAALFMLAGCKGNTDEKTSGSSDTAVVSGETETTETSSETVPKTSADKKENEKAEEETFHSGSSSDDSVNHETSHSKTTSAAEEDNEEAESADDVSGTTIADDKEEVDFPFVPLE